MSSMDSNYCSGRDIQDKWADYLNQWDWKWFVTLTMKDRSKRNGELYTPGLYACKRMWKEFCGKAWLVPDQVNWFGVMEIQQFRNGYHIYAITEDFGVPYQELRDWAWETWGFNKIRKYDNSMGAGRYLAKYLTKDKGSEFFNSEKMIKGR